VIQALMNDSTENRLAVTADLYCDRGTVHDQAGKFDRALADFAEAIRLSPRSCRAWANQAWVLATAADPKFRDGARALESALQARELWNRFQGPEWATLGTLAAAYAEAGQFEQAVETQTRVLELVVEEKASKDDAAAGQARLDLYKTGKPYHEPARPQPK